MSFHKQAWDTLSNIDVNKYTEKKGNLTYLSWSWAWGQLMHNYPASTYSFAEPVTYADGSMEIRCAVELSDGESSLKRDMWLPVMDHKNKAVINPDACQINKTKMRCLTKCLAMFGLGHYIYAGEDLPVNLNPYTDEQKSTFDMLVSNQDALSFIVYTKSITEEVYNALYNSFPDGMKVKGKEQCKALEKEGFNKACEYAETLGENATNGDKEGIAELSQELEEAEKAYIFSLLNAETKKAIKELMSN